VMSKDDSLPLLGIGWQGVEPEMAFNRQTTLPSNV
jgi:hypothetical protein